MKLSLREIDYRIDMVLLTHYFLLPFLYPGSFKQSTILYDAAEMYAIDLSYYFLRFRNSAQKVFSFIETFLIKRVNGILTVDSKGGFLEKHYKKRRQPVEVIWNVPSMQTDPDSDNLADLKPRYLGRKVIAFVGGANAGKGAAGGFRFSGLSKEKVS